MIVSPGGGKRLQSALECSKALDMEGSTHGLTIQ